MIGTMRNACVRAIRNAGTLAVFALLVALPRVHAITQEPPRFVVSDFGVTPHPVHLLVLLSVESVQRELKMTDAQIKEQAKADASLTQRFQMARRETNDIGQDS